jgi:hypothetical protein
VLKTGAPVRSREKRIGLGQGVTDAAWREDGTVQTFDYEAVNELDMLETGSSSLTTKGRYARAWRLERGTRPRTSLPHRQYIRAYPP